jgi:uncharacterized protein YgbK (DUF1537 family)
LDGVVTVCCDVTTDPAAMGPGRPLVVGISDDLTGAACTAGEFASAGLHAQACGWERAGELAGSSGVVVVDTASRLLGPDDAAARIRKAVGACKPVAGDGFYYKRVDSRLRGNVGAELRVLAELEQRPLLIAPAAPALGIQTRAGVQYAGLRGVCREDGAGQIEATSTCRLSELLPGPSRGVDLATIRGAALGATLRRVTAEGRHIVCDAERPDDLDRVATAFVDERLLGSLTPVGTYGFGGALAAAVSHRASSRLPGVLAVVGSLHPATRTQVGVAHRRNRTLSTHADLLDGGEQLIVALARSLADGRDVVLSTTAIASSPRSQILPAIRYAHELADAAREIVMRAKPRGIVLVGGELSSAMLRLLDARAVRTVSEPWPATPAVRFMGGMLEGVPGIIKSGARGGPAWLDQACALLRLVADGQVVVSCSERLHG